MEEHMVYKKEVGGSITSCPDIHREWQRSVFGDGWIFDHHHKLFGDVKVCHK